MKTKVIFYKHYTNDVVAVFIDDCIQFFEGRYQDVNPNWWKINFKQATKDEYQDIKKELELIDYNLDILNK